jgi:aspartyl-tRNA(Asn)/glutamyl-tRNA(Gln) amidotransferase subunit A
MGSSNETSHYGPVISPGGARAATSADPGGSSAARGRGRGRIAPGATGPTPAARSASRRPSPAFAGSSRPTAAARAGASSPSPARSTRRGRWRGRCATARSCSRRWPVRPEGFDFARPAGAAVGSESVERSQGKRVGIPKEYRIDGVPGEINACGTRASNG